MGMFDNFKEYMMSYIGTYGNLERCILETSKDIFNMTIQNTPDLKKIDINKINTGYFYLIQYNYNGNYIWCPILTLEYKDVKNKNIIFSINLEYLPNRFKLDIFNLIFKSYYNILDKNRENVINNQHKIPLTFEKIYNILKEYKKEYCITAFDINKIKTLYLISANIIPHFILINTHKYNSSSMKDLYNLKDGEEKLKLATILEEYDKILEEYSMNSEEYHKKLKSFENTFKLFQNEKN